MAITVGERPRERAECNFRHPRTKREYVVSGTTDRTEAIMAVAAVSPPFDEGYDIVLAQAVQLFRNGLDIDEVGGGVWEVTVRYENSETSSIEITFSVGVASKKIFTSLETVKAYDCIDGGEVEGEGDFQNIPAFKKAIGVNGSKVEGVEIEGGRVEFSVTKRTKFGTLSANYLAVLSEYAYENYVNDSAYSIFWMGQELTFAKGCLRFRSFTSKWNSEQELEITYNFGFARPVVLSDDYRVGDSDAITYEGWQYPWIHYREEVSTNATMATSVMIPVCVKIEKVYRYKPFAALAI